MTLVRIPVIPPVTFLSRGSPQHRLKMLSKTYSQLGGRQGTTKTLPGHWLRLSRAGVSWDELSKLVEGQPPRRFPRNEWKWLYRAVADDPIGKALALVLKQAQEEGLEGADVVATIGALCQCWNGPNLVIRQTLRDLAENGIAEPRIAEPSIPEPSIPEPSIPEPSIPEPSIPEPSIPEPDIWNKYLTAKQLANEWSTGRRIDVGNMHLWGASDVGPTRGEGVENQDAVFAIRAGECVVFAVADGVGSSAGAGAAARLASVTFCQTVATVLLENGRVEQAFEAGLGEVYRAARELAEHLARKHCEPELVDVAPFLDPSTTLYFVQETLAGTIERPALCTTIIGGILRPGNKEWSLHCMRVGDGIVETISADKTVKPILNMNRNESAVGAVVSPVRRVSDTESNHVTTNLSGSSWIVVSSDGLPKGHSDPLWFKLQSLIPGFDQGVPSNMSPNLAAQLLQRASVAGQSDPSGMLFKDNLSLVMIYLS